MKTREMKARHALVAALGVALIFFSLSLGTELATGTEPDCRWCIDIGLAVPICINVCWQAEAATSEPDPVSTGNLVCPKGEECTPPLWSRPGKVIVDEGPPIW